MDVKYGTTSSHNIRQIFRLDVSITQNASQKFRVQSLFGHEKER